MHSNIKLSTLDETLEKSDLLIFLVAHDCFKDLNLLGKDIIDACGVVQKK